MINFRLKKPGVFAPGRNTQRDLIYLRSGERMLTRLHIISITDFLSHANPRDSEADIFLITDFVFISIAHFSAVYSY